MKTKIYVEGGGDTNALRTKCRRGFSEFFRKAGLAGHMPRIVASGGRQTAYDDFCTALRGARDNEFIVLLVDSEAPVPAGGSPWSHLANRDQWKKPPAAADDNVHLMVQCMEAWFVADKEWLATFYGQGFSHNALPARPDIENIPKGDLFAALLNATRSTQTKGEYGKGRHSFDILAGLDPDKVESASRHAARLIATLRKKAESDGP